MSGNASSAISLTLMIKSGYLFTSEGQVSINASSALTAFAGSQFIGGITSSFSITNGSFLSFVNSTFPTGSASFCTANSMLYIVGSNTPAGCAVVSLAKVPGKFLRFSILFSNH